MKKITWTVCFLLILMFRTAAGSEKPVLKIGYAPVASHLPLIVSYDDLRLSKIDYQPELIRFSSFTSLEAALRTGAIDITAIPATVAFNIASDEYRCKECRIKIIGSVHKGGSVLVGNVNNMDTLRGKVIGVPGLDSTETMILKELMIEKHFRFGIDYEVIGDSFSSVINNLASGKIHAAFFPEPYGTIAVHEKKAAPVFDAPSAINAQYSVKTEPVSDPKTAINSVQYSVLVMKSQLIADHPTIIQAWLKSLIKACRTIEKDIETCSGRQTAILQSAFFGFPEQIITDVLKHRSGGLKFDGFLPDLSELKRVYQQAFDMKLIMKSIDWNDLLYPDLMNQASGNIKP